jgi:hypothetical protein
MENFNFPSKFFYVLLVSSRKYMLPEVGLTLTSLLRGIDFSSEKINLYAEDMGILVMIKK